MVPKVLALVSFGLLACGGQLGGDDRGNPPDAGSDTAACVDLETSAFDTSCTTKSDCIAVVAGGPLCDGYDCYCPNATISAASADAYSALVKQVHPAPNGSCGCPLFGTPQCIAARCVLCPAPGGPGPTPPGCPDGGV